MICYTSMEAIEETAPTVVTLGKFDGVHRGHQKLLAKMKELSSRQSLRSVVFTFDVSPQVKLGTQAPRMLMTNKERREHLEARGIDVLVECPFTEAIRNMEAEDFLDQILVGRLHAQAVVVGADFHFGKNRKGNPAFLKEWGERAGLKILIIPKEMDCTREISSTYIREELIAGHMEKVQKLQGRPYSMTGEVVHGNNLGHTIGFPTLNQIPEEGKLLPPNGVYASRTLVRGSWYRSLSNLGCKPTVAGEMTGLETYLLDFEGDLYGETATVELYSFRRPEQKFASLEKLKKQLAKDLEDVNRYFSSCDPQGTGTP